MKHYDDAYHPEIDAPLPASSGTTGGVKLLIVAGVLVSIMQGAFVASASTFGRVWPAADVVKIQLPPSNF